ncbi:MAG: hypothetical protein M3Q12_01140 [Pseudomonadota bacterium]|nr:hypothetical protein [Pseudomonadota bacterium]
MKNFDKDGYGFLLSFIRKTKGQPFPAEAVTLAGLKKGVVPDDLRAWGKVFVQARDNGYIARCAVPFRRTMGNGTLTLGWVAL